ncbi:MAG: DUF166 family protein [Chloroflexota bacterium]
MRILTIITGDYGRRHVDNIRAHGPKEWSIDTWEAPTLLPLIVDYPEEFVPESLQPADLLLSFAEHKGVAELLPEVAKITGAQAVIASVDSESWLPRGLARQLRGWLEDMGVASATPKPLCSLDTGEYSVTRREKLPVNHPFIVEFARYFGKPELDIQVDETTNTVSKAQVKRDAVCGCARYTAEKLVGVSVDEAVEKAGLLHHHYPCLASMVKDTDFNDTLMHVSGNLLKDDVLRQVRDHLTVQPIVPAGLVSETKESEQTG